MAKMARSAVLVALTLCPAAAMTLGDEDNETKIDNTCHESAGNCMWKCADAAACTKLGLPATEACDWDEKKGKCGTKECYYPMGDSSKLTGDDKKLGITNNYEERYNEQGAVGMSNKKGLLNPYRGRTRSEMCLNQKMKGTRFDSEKLTLEPDWDSCIKSFYTVGHESEHPIKPSSISPKDYATPASATHMKNFAISCDKVAKRFSNGSKRIVLFVANTPRKAELEDWMQNSPHFPTIVKNYKLSGTKSTTDKLLKSFSHLGVTKDSFIKSDLHTESGPKGGDIQGASLMAAGYVRALFFFQSYMTECHRCDIQGMVDICLGAEKTMKAGTIGCAFTAEEADKLAAELASEVKSAPKGGTAAAAAGGGDSDATGQVVVEGS
jgi:methylglyoxal synthase